MSAEDAPFVTRTDKDGIAHIVLDSPANRNALSRKLIGELTTHLAQAGTDPSLHGILLTSSQRVFCSGADLREAQTLDMVEGARLIIGVQRLIAAAEVPVVVRLDGPVRAGGLGIVGSADIVVAAPEATFALTEVKLGLAASVISVPLRRRMSGRAASLYFLTGRTFDAQAAKEAGLVTALASASEIEQVIEGILEELRGASRQGLTEGKRLLNADFVAAFDADGEDLAQLSGRLFHSEEARRRMAAFTNRG